MKSLASASRFIGFPLASEHLREDGEQPRNGGDEDPGNYVCNYCAEDAKGPQLARLCAGCTYGNLESGGEGGIRTLDRVVRPYNGLANRRLQPLGHLSGVYNQALTGLPNTPTA